MFTSIKKFCESLSTDLDPIWTEDEQTLTPVNSKNEVNGEINEEGSLVH